MNRVDRTRETPVNRVDNPRGGPERPFGVAQPDLEQALRETLTRQVAAPRPLAVDPAGHAVRRADRMRRRRTVAGVALSAVAFVTVSAGLAQLRTGPTGYTSPTVVIGDPSGPPTVPTPTVTLTGPAFSGLSLISGSKLIVDGRLIDLGGIGPVDRGLPVTGGGWLLIGRSGAAGRTVWSVKTDGTSRVVLAGADEVAVAPGGQRLAWREGPQLFVATVTNGQVVPGVRTPAPETAAPVGFAGDDVLVRLRPDQPGFAIWRTNGTPFQAGKDRSVRDVHGRLPDGRLVALVSVGTATRPCLALLDPTRDLARTRTGCAVPALREGAASVSPDGRWLLVTGSSGTTPSAEDAALLIDLQRAFGPTPTVRPVGPAMVGEVSWLGPEAVYPAADGTLIRFRPDRPDPASTSTPTVPGLSAEDPPVLVAPPAR
ncbi:hypothetical protein [Micromonospora cathayae]|uniref:WD40-like Beta Propeller Repeat n=1 Tax=Micromonospora cathayae TaxID=3028804 RepID=A0ABY7ZUF6_9ACTN|nr:hypothetical protein [Micromonospora sp. HUAS 3]WDZ86674.1 hypothetical protein PVK37_09895 [Micromonospora sp. HUAS 3]